MTDQPLPPALTAPDSHHPGSSGADRLTALPLALAGATALMQVLATGWRLLHLDDMSDAAVPLFGLIGSVTASLVLVFGISQGMLERRHIVHVSRAGTFLVAFVLMVEVMRAVLGMMLWSSGFMPLLSLAAARNVLLAGVVGLVSLATSVLPAWLAMVLCLRLFKSRLVTAAESGITWTGLRVRASLFFAACFATYGIYLALVPWPGILPSLAGLVVDYGADPAFWFGFIGLVFMGASLVWFGAMMALARHAGPMRPLKVALTALLAFVVFHGSVWVTVAILRGLPAVREFLWEIGRQADAMLFLQIVLLLLIALWLVTVSCGSARILRSPGRTGQAGSQAGITEVCPPLTDVCPP